MPLTRQRQIQGDHRMNEKSDPSHKRNIGNNKTPGSTSLDKMVQKKKAGEGADRCSGHSLSRKRFLGQAAAATAGLMIVPRHVLGGAGYMAPSDKLNVAAVEIGRATSELQSRG